MLQSEHSGLAKGQGLKVCGSNVVTLLNGYLFLSGISHDLELRMDTTKTPVMTRLDYLLKL